MSQFDLSPLFRHWIGFDELRTALEEGDQYQSFPTYNIEKLDESNYRIILALPGFKANEINIEQQAPHLVIQGKPDLKGEVIHYIHQGISRKKFELRFTLADHMKVEQAQFNDGLLSIKLIKEVPQHMLPQKISINT